MKTVPVFQIKVRVDIIHEERLISIVEDLTGKHFEVEVKFGVLGIKENYQLFMEAIRCSIEVRFTRNYRMNTFRK